MADYTQYRLENWDWVREYGHSRGEQAFLGYVNGVCRFLAGMKPGSFFTVEGNVKPENTDLFIKTCCMFILETGREPDAAKEYLFSNDYTKILCRARHTTKQSINILNKHQNENGNRKRD
jgi:hypothetical protein